MIFSLILIACASLFILTISFILKKEYPASLGSGLTALCLAVFALNWEYETTYVALDRSDSKVEIKTYDGYSIKCATAFGELIPLVNDKQATLNRMRVEWNDGSVIESRIGDTVYVYRMAEIKSFLLRKDTALYLCIDDHKDRYHEYDLFQQHLMRGVKEELIKNQ